MEIMNTNDVFDSWEKDVKKIKSTILEDNQFISLPIVIIKENKKCLTSVVFNISLGKNKIITMQQYFWDGTRREIFLCKQEYKVDKPDFLVFTNDDYKKIYMDKLRKIWEFAYNKNINSKEYALLCEYVDTLNILGTIGLIYEKTSAMFFEWFNSFR